MAYNRRLPLIRVQTPISDDAQALRELARTQARKLTDCRDLARRAKLALADHDLEMVRNFLNQIQGMR